MHPPTSPTAPPPAHAARALGRAAARTFEASDLTALSAGEMLARPPVSDGRVRATRARTHAALQKTQSMLEQAAASLQRSKVALLPMGVSQSPF